MIKVENLSYSFPQKDLFNKISFTLEDNKHCAFIGTSGSGKSTLVDIIMDPENYMYDGKLEMDPNCKIGYVSQFPLMDKPEETTVFNYIAEDFITLENEISRICSELETSSDTEQLLDAYQNALDAFDAIGGEDYESKINKKLNLANLNHCRDLKISELSGGEFKLIQVIREMLHNPDLLIMDEPDVFLDFDNLNSLKDLINTHKKILLVITHNRFLLNHCFDKVIHLENMEVQEFDGRYMDYNLMLLQTKIELQELAIADEEEIQRNAILIDKLRMHATNSSDAANGRSLKARVKIQERLEARRVKAPFVDIKQPYIELEASDVLEEGTAVELKDFDFSYEDVLLENVNFEINSTDKVALIGPNGTGKTTLIREIFKNESDSIITNDHLKLAYLSQMQNEGLKDSNTILDEFYEVFDTYGEIKNHIFGYGFEESYLKQQIGSLSGGEKNILQLAKIAAMKSNMLLLDEPTSHLDTYAQIALENAVNSYKGAILMISHDYYFIVNTMDYVLFIDNKTIRKMKMKKFRRMIYANHFNKDYLELEQRKKDLETEVALALKHTNFEQAKLLSEKLEELIKLL